MLTIKEKNYKFDYIKFKNFCSSRTKQKHETKMRENICNIYN